MNFPTNICQVQAYPQEIFQQPLVITEEALYLTAVRATNLWKTEKLKLNPVFVRLKLSKITNMSSRVYL